MNFVMCNYINGLGSLRGPLTALGMTAASLVACEEQTPKPAPAETYEVRDTSPVAGVPSTEPEPIAWLQTQSQDIRFIHFNRHEWLIGYADQSRLYDLDPADAQLHADLMVLDAGKAGQEYLVRPGLVEGLKESVRRHTGMGRQGMPEARPEQVKKYDAMMKSGIDFAREEIGRFSEQLSASQEMSLQPDDGGGIGGFNLTFKNASGLQRRAHCTIIENRLRDGGKQVVLHQLVFKVSGLEIILDRKAELDKVWPAILALYAQGRPDLSLDHRP